MAALTDDDRKALLRLARSTIQSGLMKNAKVQKLQKLTPALKEKRGCFVTLHKKDNLRGCIGSIEPEKPLFEGVEENALNAAFRDPRFLPLQPHELLDVEIEISVLTTPEPLKYSTAQDLIDKLRPGVDGVILKKGMAQSTFLPQVWDQLPQPEAFLSNLCLKAGLPAEDWKKGEVQVFTYQVQSFEEKEI